MTTTTTQPKRRRAPSSKARAVRPKADATTKRRGVAATAAEALSFGVGDVVLIRGDDGTVVGQGRVCTPPLLNTVCVAMQDLGCLPISVRRLTLAPLGSAAPSCMNCNAC